MRLDLSFVVLWRFVELLTLLLLLGVSGLYQLGRAWFALSSWTWIY